MTIKNDLWREYEGYRWRIVGLHPWLFRLWSGRVTSVWLVSPMHVHSAAATLLVLVLFSGGVRLHY